MLDPADFRRLIGFLGIKSVLVMHPGELDDEVGGLSESYGSSSVRLTLRPYLIGGADDEGSNTRSFAQYCADWGGVDLKGYDLVYVTGLFDLEAVGDPTIRIAKLRDSCQGQLILEMPADVGQSLMGPSEFFALGFHELRLDSDVPGTQLYRYSLSDYKTTPDWFNSRFWAHPERWNTD